MFWRGSIGVFQAVSIDRQTRGDFFLSEKAGGPPSEPTIWGFVVCFVWFVCLSRVYY